MSAESKKPTLAIVSTQGIACGIAYASDRLAASLRDKYDTTIIAVEAELGRDRRIFGQGGMSRHVDKICEEVKKYDYLIIECELGIFSYKMDVAAKFMMRVIQAKGSNVVLSMHAYGYTIYSQDGKTKGLFKSLLRGRVFEAIRLIRANRQFIRLGKFWKKLAKIERANRLRIVHFNNEDANRIGLMYGFEGRDVFPLSYFTYDEIDKKKKIGKKFLTDRSNFSEDDVILVYAGFLTEYKGIEVILSALQTLPDKYKLFIAGASNITFSAVNHFIDGNPYVKKLSGDISRRKMNDRVFFAGELSDDEIADCFATGDIVVLPYYETTQCTSGPGTLAAELSNHVVTSNIRAFREIDEYFGAGFNFFEVGNSREMSDVIAGIDVNEERQDVASFDADDRAKVYADLLEKTNG